MRTVSLNVIKKTRIPMSMLVKSPEDTPLCRRQDLEDGPIYLPLPTDGSEVAEAPRLCPYTGNFIPQA